MKKYLFVDRDGTILKEPTDEQIDCFSKVEFVPGAIEGLMRLSRAGFSLVLISNQDGLGTSSFPLESFEGPQNLMIKTLESCGVEFEGIYICPHRPEDNCRCRKPGVALLKSILAKGYDAEKSAVIGDRLSDLHLAESLGVRAYILGRAMNWGLLSRSLLGLSRSGLVENKTKETDISLFVDLQSEADSMVKTPSLMLTHLVNQILVHGRIAARIEVKGDWDLDPHHTIEDLALALGSAIREALGNKAGIERYGFVLPMDEALASCALDLSGRPHFSGRIKFAQNFVGDVPTEMIAHFFQSFAVSLGASLHIDAQGENQHHLAEVCFKALGRCLDQATRISSSSGIPSSKGVL